MLHFLDIFGTFVFAISGAFRAVRHELDILGVLVLSIATGVGGGIVRDIMLGIAPPAALQHQMYIIVTVIGGLIVFFAAPKIAPRWDYVMIADAIGLSVFAAIGAAKAQSAELGFVGIIMLAAITATGGGLIRDLFVIEIPAVLKSDFYASAAMIGGACFAALAAFGAARNTNIAITITVTFAIRILAMWYKFSLPRVHSLSASPSQLTQMRKSKKKKD